MKNTKNFKKYNLSEKKCLKCKNIFYIDDSYMPVLDRKQNCRDCNPSTAEKKYSYDDKLGWIDDFHKSNCEKCNKKIFYKKFPNPWHRCEDCDPSDYHNKFDYDKETGDYTLRSQYIWNNLTRKHRWFSTHLSETLLYSCYECKFEQTREARIKEYESVKDFIVVVAEDTKVSDITVEGILYNIPIDRDSLLIVKSYAKGEITGENLDLSGMNLTGLTFKGYKFMNCDFSGSILDNVTFLDVKFENCKMVKVRASSIIIKRCEFKSVNFSGSTMQGEIFSIFENCTFIDTSFERTYFGDSTIKCDNILSGTVFNDVSFSSKMDSLNMIYVKLISVYFNFCGMQGIVLPGQDLSGKNFDHCDLSHANLNKCNMGKSIFRSCIMNGTSMKKVKAPKATFEGCDFNCANMEKGDFRKCLFNDNKYVSITIDKAQFKGATFKGKYIMSRTFFDTAASRP